MGGFSYPDEFFYEADILPGAMNIGAGVLGIFAIFYLFVLFLSVAFSVVTYVLHSLSLYTMANRRGIRNGWLAWLPVGNLWLLGSISDQYEYVTKGKIKNRRKILLGLSIVVAIIYALWLIGMIAGLVAGEYVPSVLWILLGFFLLAVVAVTLTVCKYFAYYDLFRSSEPSNAVLYLVLSIVFNITLPLFVFVCQKKDLGMPPRKQSPVQKAAEDTYAPEEVFVVPDEGYAMQEEFEEESKE